MQESIKIKNNKHYVIKFVSDLRQVGGFFRVSFTNKTDRHDIAETLLKVVLNTIKQTNTHYFPTRIGGVMVSHHFASF
jgi:hypothetical protein